MHIPADFSSKLPMPCIKGIAEGDVHQRPRLGWGDALRGQLGPQRRALGHGGLRQSVVDDVRA